jgi:hypothetical protein
MSPPARAGNLFTTEDDEMLSFPEIDSRTPEEVARLERVREANRAEEARQRAARDARAAAERAREQDVLAARAGRLAAVAERLVEKLRADQELTRWVDPARILAAGDAEPPVNLTNYSPCIIVTPGRTTGDGHGLICVESRAADHRVLEFLWAAETDEVSALVAGRTRVAGSGPLRLALATARHEGTTKVDERRLVENKFVADLGERVPVWTGFFSRKDHFTVQIGADPAPTTRPPARRVREGWTANGRSYGYGAT